MPSAPRIGRLRPPVKQIALQASACSAMPKNFVQQLGATSGKHSTACDQFAVICN
jgi:hypothetical protein